ncbi:hypothetical protein OK074_7529 [Actinobacteria bacterium OK074]|nr:hypothetical protein OK074_7529 [Actinobacteria bacterium OK074]
MAPYGSDDNTQPGDELRGGRHKAARYAVPVAVVGVAAATIGLVPALADSGDPNLPKISAQQLLEKIAASDVQQVSGTVKITTDLGLPDVSGLASGLTGSSGAGAGGSSADPSSRLLELASGTHTLRVAADGQDKQKVSVIEKAAEYSLIHNGDDVWAYDSSSNSAYHATTSADEKAGGKADGKSAAPKGDSELPATPKDFADQALKAADSTTSVTVDGTAQVAGRDAYKLLIKPKESSGTTVGAISIAVDAKTGLPLKFTLTPASGGAAVVDVGFTQVSFAKPAASTFDFTPPKGAKVTEDGAAKGGTGSSEKDSGKNGLKRDGSARGGASTGGLDDLTGLKTLGKGWSSVVELDSGSDSGSKSESPSTSGGSSDISGFLNSLGDHVTGDFGSGTVYSTRLVNALVTDDGKVYVGAVTKSTLVKAADEATAK